MIMNRMEDSLVKTLDEVMHFLENYTIAWHHWLLILSLLKLGGSGTKAQILPVYKREGFSPHAIDKVFQMDLEDLGAAIEVEGGIKNLDEHSTIYLTEDPNFRKFLKKNLRDVVRKFKTQTRD
ncbi:MAG: hypothetical protein AM326_12070 [Candidatus Thorarchaeota archaeon SMTZ-45]|nr:MAG: hypothetical protein AM326_12070 [Candidatus Thorarchaeota archaeon SMTZ-45]KXH73837.1 MAG: hypothetical protein AM325_13530 [Candidatus Thorarchaeota archaeon SMTZ1-45]